MSISVCLLCIYGRIISLIADNSQVSTKLLISNVLLLNVLCVLIVMDFSDVNIMLYYLFIIISCYK